MGNRIVSLVPCITETLVAAGRGDQIVGRTRYCPDVDGAAVVGGVWDPDIDQITALRPDLVLVDPEEQRAEQLVELETRLPVKRITVRSLEEALAFADLDDSPGAAPTPPIPALVPIWLRPLRLLGAGRYGDAILRAAGFDNLISGEGYLGIPEGDDVEALGALLDGALLLLPTEPWSFSDADAARHRAALPGLRDVRLVDGRDLFWYGARTPSALRRLRMLHRELAQGDKR